VRLALSAVLLLVSLLIVPTANTTAGFTVATQLLAVVVSVGWTGFWTAFIMLVIKFLPGVGIDINTEEEDEGLDLSQVPLPSFLVALLVWKA